MTTAAADISPAASAGAHTADGGTGSVGANEKGGSGSALGGGNEGLAGEQTSGGAPAASPEPGALAGSYRMVAGHSSKCMDAYGALSSDAEVTIAQRGCDSGRHQAFVLTDAGGGYYSLTVEGSGDCVDLQGQLIANETPIVRAACANSPSQAWLPVAQDDDSYFLVNRSSGKCLEVPAGSLDDVSLQQYTCSVGRKQGWILASLAPQALPLIVDDFFAPNPWSNTGALVSAHDSGACDGDRAPNARGDCHAFKLDNFPDGTTNVGATWLHPLGNWGARPGVVIAAGAKRVRFLARGAQGGEKIRFNAASQQNETFKDGFTIDYQEVPLSTTWQEVSLDISSSTYADGVISGFAYWAVAASNTAPLTFYVDDITWE